MRMCTRDRVMRVVLCVAIVCFVCVPVKRAHAILPAVPVVAGGAAAFAEVAAAAGISEGLLAAGMGALMVAGTGVGVIAGNWTGEQLNEWLNNGGAIPEYGEGHYDLPGWVPWDNLTDDQLGELEGQGITSEDDYMHAWWGNVLIESGLLEMSESGGGYEPNNGDDDGDGVPDNRYNKWINAAVLVGATGASVGVDVVADVLADNIKRMMFGKENGEFDLSLTSVANIDNHPLYMRVPQYMGPVSMGAVSLVALQKYYSNRYEHQIAPATGTVNVMWNSSSGRWYVPNLSGTQYTYNINNSSWSNTTTTNSYTLANTDVIPANNHELFYLNPLYAGKIVYNNSVTYENGVWGNIAPSNITYEYGQYSDVPSALPYNVMGGSYNNYITYINNQAPAGQTMAVSLPSVAGTGAQQYSDYVKAVPTEDVVPVPETSPTPEPSPDPDPELTPFQTDFRSRVTEMLNRPLEQLFPFCLITDLGRLVDIVSDAARSDDSLPETYVIPLDAFGVEGMERIVIDLAPLKQLGNDVRPFTTALFVTGLLVGTFRFFLVRGGE